MPVYHRLISSKWDLFPDRRDDAEIWKSGLFYVALKKTKKKPYHLVIARWELCHKIPCRYYDVYCFSHTRNYIFWWKKQTKDLSNVFYQSGEVPRNWWSRPYIHLKLVNVCEHNLISTLLSFSIVIWCLYRIPTRLTVCTDASLSQL